MYLDVVHIYIFVFFKLDEWLQSYDLKCTNMYNLDMWGVCTLANFLSFPTISNRFRPVWLKNHPQLQIWPKKWIRLVQNGQIWSFYTIFYHFPQNEAEIVLYTSGPVSLKERLLYTLNKLFVKQVKSCLLLLDLDPFILQCSLHNIKYIKFTSP